MILVPEGGASERYLATDGLRLHVFDKIKTTEPRGLPNFYLWPKESTCNSKYYIAFKSLPRIGVQKKN